MKELQILFQLINIFSVAERYGYLTTVLGRRRYFPHISSPNTSLRAQAKRQAFKSVHSALAASYNNSSDYFSFLIQGSAADLAKTALLRSEEKLAEAEVESVLVMMIHDEMVWEVKEADISTAAAVVKQSLETCGAALGLELETRVRITVGKTWGDLSELADCS